MERRADDTSNFVQPLEYLLPGKNRVGVSHGALIQTYTTEQIPVFFFLLSFFCPCPEALIGLLHCVVVLQ